MADETTDPQTPGAFPESVLAASDVLQGLLGQVVILDTCRGRFFISADWSG